jgi:hypothetical protein
VLPISRQCLPSLFCHHSFPRVSDSSTRNLLAACVLCLYNMQRWPGATHLIGRQVRRGGQHPGLHPAAIAQIITSVRVSCPRLYARIWLPNALTVPVQSPAPPTNGKSITTGIDLASRFDGPRPSKRNGNRHQETDPRCSSLDMKEGKNHRPPEKPGDEDWPIESELLFRRTTASPCATASV